MDNLQGIIEDMLVDLSEIITDWDEFKLIRDNIDELQEVMYEDDRDEDVEIGPDPDDAYDREREERERLERGDRLWD